MQKEIKLLRAENEGLQGNIALVAIATEGKTGASSRHRIQRTTGGTEKRLRQCILVYVAPDAGSAHRCEDRRWIVREDEPSLHQLVGHPAREIAELKNKVRRGKLPPCSYAEAVADVRPSRIVTSREIASRSCLRRSPEKSPTKGERCTFYPQRMPGGSLSS